ncbi:gamma-glutamyltransferase [Penicillium brasilianum]|uniref:Gamma-glutamyltransferase n=1 Tax=Penicillium brasilianum TaxID=104259 RepID=A0A1S9RGU8_PENBI|nr:gamma-glutamyltransferase [Penicillium brasilianum]
MELTGLGGGGFALVRASNGSFDAIDFRESAPAQASEDMYQDNIEASVYGGLAVGVPGELHGLEYLHRHYGTLPWDQLIRPASKVAREGFRVGKRLVKAMDRLGPDSVLTKDPLWSVDFAPNGTRLGLGDIMTRKRYGRLLDTIARKGPEAFYTGNIADATVRAIQSKGGIMTIDDLADYRVLRRAPVMIDYRGYRLASCGSPAGGAVLLQIMNIVNGYADIGRLDSLNLSVHRLDEAMRFAFASRAYLGDPEFVEGMVDYEARMLNLSIAAEIRNRILDNSTQPISAYNPDGLESLITHGTSHLSVIDQSGMAVSLTSTINLNFGSLVMVPETGLILNNEMNDFSVPNTTNEYGYAPSPENFIRPRKRPLSSITPVIVDSLNDETKSQTAYFVTGGAGGSRIITATVLSLWRVLDQKMSLIEALEAPRWHDQLIPNSMYFEQTFSNDTVAAMRDRGHDIIWGDALSNVQAVRRMPNGTLEAAAEPRQPGSGGFAV